MQKNRILKYTVLQVVILISGLVILSQCQLQPTKTEIYSSVNSIPAHYKQVFLQSTQTWILETNWTGVRADIDFYIYKKGANTLQSTDLVFSSSSQFNNPQFFAFTAPATQWYVIHYVMRKRNSVPQQIVLNCSGRLITDTTFAWTQNVTFPDPTNIFYSRQFTVPAGCPVIQIQQTYPTQSIKLISPDPSLSKTRTQKQSTSILQDLSIINPSFQGNWKIQFSNSTINFNTHKIKISCISQKCNDNIKMGTQACDSVVDEGCYNCAEKVGYSCTENQNLVSICVII